MAKQKKNSNYVTEKTTAAKAEKEAQKIKEKKQKNIKIIAIASISFVSALAIILGILFACGAFEYSPPVTSHVNIELQDYGTLHVELYGKDAPDTVQHFKELADNKYFNGLTLHTLSNGLLYGGSKSATNIEEGINGEFTANGFNNKVKMEKGVIVMARGELNNSGYGQFFIVTEEEAEELQGNYAAFGRITNLDVLDSMLEKIGSVDGEINPTTAPKIVSISDHDHD